MATDTTEADFLQAVGELQTLVETESFTFVLKIVLSFWKLYFHFQRIYFTVKFYLLKDTNTVFFIWYRSSVYLWTSKQIKLSQPHYILRYIAYIRKHVKHFNSRIGKRSGQFYPIYHWQTLFISLLMIIIWLFQLTAATDHRYLYLIFKKNKHSIPKHNMLFFLIS